MDDEKIIELYWQRSDLAITATADKYGLYCRTVANNILHNESDSEECLNDTYFNAWKSIPPNRPNSLKAYLATITRNVALNMYDRFRAKKRNGELNDIKDEFFECLPSPDLNIADELMLKESINGFLGSLSHGVRVIFMQRYWYALSINEIALRAGMSVSNVKVILHRTRKEFRSYLEKEEIYL